MKRKWSLLKKKVYLKLNSFFKHEINRKDLAFLEKLGILLLLLIFSLVFLDLNKSISYDRYERVQFKSTGATLYANLYYPSKDLNFQDKRPLIIYCHGIGSKKDFDLRIPIEFTKRGFYVASLDYQGHGESGGSINNFNKTTGIPALAQDCSRLLDKLEKLSFYSDVNTSQIGLIGHSLGGMVVLMNQALDPRFNVTVAWAPLVNFEPPRFGLEWQDHKQYIPINLLNEANTNNLLIIMHVKDEILDFSDNALKAQNLTNCKVINITKPLIGGGHQLFSNKVLVESIKWFEAHFFSSETINGSINITFIWNYILIFINLILLIIIVLLLISYASEFFRFNNESSTNFVKMKNLLKFKSAKTNNILKIVFYTTIFIFNWYLFERLFGLIGIFHASLTFLLGYFIIKVLFYIKKPKIERVKFNLIEYLRSRIKLKFFIFTTISAWYFIGIYLIFSFYYPFAFIWPSNITNMLISIAIFPIYFSIELLFRKVIYPQLKFVKSEKSKEKLMIFYAIIIYINLMILTRSLLYLPSVLFTYIIFLIVSIQNTLIYEHTKHFFYVLVTSFDIIQLFFSAVISNVIGIGAVSHLF
ncbi:MAG: alpha/beta hydrolase family protein [Promethearchaeota archaeon]